MSPRFRTFAEFWPHYLREHARRETRWLHVIGTAAGIVSLASFLRTRTLARAAVTLVAGYGPAWLSHAFVEHNRPATFDHPLWSLRADLKMFALICAGAMDAELARVAVETASPPEPGRDGVGRRDARDLPN